MSKSSRNVGVALAGLAALVCSFGSGLYLGVLNYPQEERYDRYRYAADKPIEVDPALPSPAKADALEYRTPCDEPKGKDESDLCAQWRAAKATEFSATWTRWGTIVGFIGSSFLLWQIILTRRAVIDTSNATLAMNRQNELTEQAQRPWVVIENIDDFQIGVGTGENSAVHLSIGGRIVLRNIGKAPALDIVIMIPHLQGLKVTDDWPEVREAVERIYQLPERYSFYLAPGETGGRPIMVWGPRDEVLKPWHISDQLTVYPAGTFRVAVGYRSRENGTIHVTEKEWVMARDFRDGSTDKFGAQNWTMEDFKTNPFPHAARVGRTIRIT